MKKILFLLLIPVISIANPVLIISCHCQRPEFIEWQYLTFQKFMKDDYTFIIFNDAKDPSIEKEINVICKKLNLSCIRIPQEIHNRPYLHRLPGENYHSSPVRCANVVQYSLDNYGFDYDGPVVIIDSDMFLIRPFSVNELLNTCDIAAVGQSRSTINYLWNGLVFLNMPKLPNKRELNWNCGRVQGSSVDVGGYTYYYLQKYPSVKVNYLGVNHSLNFVCDNCRRMEKYECTHNAEKLDKITDDPTILKFLKNNPVNVEFILGFNFLHYRGASWDFKTPQYHQQKTKLIKQFLSEILEYNLN